MPSRSQPSVILIKDSSSLAVVSQEYMTTKPWKVTPVATGKKALEMISTAVPNAILLDLQLPEMTGMKILKHVYKAATPSPVVIIAGHGSVDVAMEAMRYGAFNFLINPLTAKRPLVTVVNSLKNQHFDDTDETCQKNFDRKRFYRFIGHSSSMQMVYRIIQNAAVSTATVLITGESGTGKELCAEAIHKESPRRDRTLVILNCAAIPKDLMESEIFGHVRGAFSGAVQDRQGAATRADGGTLFLDEIGEMSLDLQSKLLRFIQTGTFQKVGGNKMEKADIRFVSATNRDPWKEVQKGRFRDDLYYRLNVIPIHLPSLNEREEDVLLIANHFLKKYSKEEGKHFHCFSEDVENIFRNFSWPGNVRQLQNVV